MATIKGTKKQARKRHRQSLEHRTRNKAVRTRVRRQMRKLRAVVAEGDGETAAKMLAETFSIIDVGWRKGVLHRNTASRYKARMTRQVQSLLANQGA